MIKLDELYQIEADERCYILSKTKEGKNKKTGEPITYKKAVGYYTRLPQAILAYSDELERTAIQSADMSLKEAVNTIRECRESVKRIIREAMPELEGR